MPGCYVKSPSNCPKQSSFSAPDYKRDIWGEANMNAANDKNTCLVTRKKEFDSWCGSSDTKMKFVPRQQRSLPTQVPSLAPTPPPTLSPMSPLPTPLPPRKSTSSTPTSLDDTDSGVFHQQLRPLSNDSHCPTSVLTLFAFSGVLCVCLFCRQLSTRNRQEHALRIDRHRTLLCAHAQTSER